MRRRSARPCGLGLASPLDVVTLAARQARSNTGEMQTGQVGALWWVVMHGEVTAAHHADFLRTLTAWGASTTPTVFLHLSHSGNTPGAPERKEIGDVVKRFARPENLRGYALVTDSVLVRGTLRAVNWIVRTPVPQAVFGHPRAALSWLEKLDVGVDADAVDQALRAQATPYRDLRW